jgi:RNA polymerase sigma-70 factor (ECF subfamily)
MSDGEAVEVERVFREVYGQAVATLVRVFGDITVAEDAVQDAFVVAARRWRGGIPPNPAGWIVTTARHRAIDQLRRATRGRALSRARDDLSASSSHTTPDAREQPGPLTDDRLRLIFTCCHPALRTEHQVALTLRLLGGLRVDEIARAFLVTEPTMAKRLVRAKFKIKATNIPYRVPAASDLPARLRPVLSVLYLIYGAGADELVNRAQLRDEAIRLARALATLMPDEPEAAGLLALMLLNESRVPARTRDDAVVLLRDQDRTTWDHNLISEGHSIVRDCIRRGRPGPYQLQAAIQAVHCNAQTFAATDWAQIVTLYDHLYSMMPTPIVTLNRAIALTETEGPEVGLAALDALGGDLDSYYALHAARAAALRRLGRSHAARIAYQRAAELATSTTDRDYFVLQLQELSSHTS